MGFWKQLFGMEELPRGQYPPVRNPPQHQGEVVITYAKNISEPVLSIICTLKDGEWSFKLRAYSKDWVTFTHEWFGHKLEIFRFDRYGAASNIECQSEWMTKDEKLAVGDVCWQIYQGRVKWEREQSLAKQRESFMNLTKGY